MLSRISGATKNYAWGSKELVSDFFGLAESSEPIAEIWFGTHPLGESKSLAEDKSLSESSWQAS
jgi:mannose-6-phosphate isomerase